VCVGATTSSSSSIKRRAGGRGRGAGPAGELRRGDSGAGMDRAVAEPRATRTRSSRTILLHHGASEYKKERGRERKEPDE
jgi:hypothetical protein